MSNRAITWAYGQAIKSAGAKFVLVTLADMADEKNSCYPGQDLLADRTGQTSRTVRRQLVELEQAGFIQRSARRREGVRTSDRYVLSVDVQQGQNGLPDMMSGSSESPDIHDSQPDIHDRVTGHDVRVTQREPSEEPSETPAPPTPIRQDIERVCDRLADAVEANGSKRPRVTDTWRKSARLMLDNDGRTEEQISKAIDWSQADTFWRVNILSMPKLREKYDQLRLAAARPVQSREERAADPLRFAR